MKHHLAILSTIALVLGSYSIRTHADDRDRWHHGDDHWHGNYCDRWNGDDCEHWHHDHDDGVHVRTSCAPEVVDSNVQIADKVLIALSQDELRNEDVFKRNVAEITAMPAGEDKTDHYFNLVGIHNTSDASEVMNFIYARQVEQKYVAVVKNKLKLNDAQATLVVSRLTTALKPR